MKRGTIREIALYAWTARFLNPRQLLHFALRKLGRESEADCTPSGILDQQVLGVLQKAAQQLRGGGDAASKRRADAVVGGRFEFLNHIETLDTVDWTAEHVSPLWNYNLQYFDYAVDLTQAYLATGDQVYISRLIGLIEAWMDGTAAGRGIAWEPYPSSIRIVNWTFALLLLHRELDENFKQKLADSLYRQLSHLEKSIEWHLLANHLQKNLVALFIGGLLFQNENARTWRAKALRELWRQVVEQVNHDGGHLERSPMYHAIALADLLETIHLANVVGQRVPDTVQVRVARMADALLALTRDTGSLFLFNDAANNIAPPTATLTALMQTILKTRVARGVGDWSLPVTGFYGCRDQHLGDSLVVDGGNPAPRYQPGHAHCGLLGYELDLAGMPVIVDSGVHGYAGDRYREYVRSTRAHNTVAINGKEQSEVWGAFRMARRARLVATRTSFDDGAYTFEGGYRPYHSRVSVHTRRIRKTSAEFEVTDQVKGTGQVIDSFIHFHPDFRVEESSEAVIATGNGINLRIEAFGVDGVSLHKGEESPIQGWYCPEFGKAFPQYVIAMRVNRNTGAPFGYRITIVSRPR